jgi:aspartyl-tRNA synthetase
VKPVRTCVASLTWRRPTSACSGNGRAARMARTFSLSPAIRWSSALSITQPDPERPEYSYSFDLLFRGLELVTGGQRLHRYADYLSALAARGLDPAPFAGYLQAFKYGMPPHGGFAIGLERWVARLVEAANIRETTLFPRDPHRLPP